MVIFLPKLNTPIVAKISVKFCLKYGSKLLDKSNYRTSNEWLVPQTCNFDLNCSTRYTFDRKWLENVNMLHNACAPRRTFPSSIWWLSWVFFQHKECVIIIIIIIIVVVVLYLLYCVFLPIIPLAWHVILSTQNKYAKLIQIYISD
jgi:hypothetical protein